MNQSSSSYRPLAAAAADSGSRPGVRGERLVVPQHRIDGAHRIPPATASDPPLPAPQTGSSSPATAIDLSDDLLRLHAEELIDRLQAWANDLDAREAQLNARTALQDHRERQFRLQSQSRQAELDQALRDAQRLSEHLQAEARRIALTDPAVD